jgi:hypothetical protein
MTSREACQSAAEEALFADYRPLRAGFAEDYLDSGEDVEGEMAFDTGDGVMHFPVSRDQLFELRNVTGKEIPMETEKTGSDEVREMTSTRRKRHTKMKNHKRRKLYVYYWEAND